MDWPTGLRTDLVESSTWNMLPSHAGHFNRQNRNLEPVVNHYHSHEKEKSKFFIKRLWLE